MMGIAPRLTIQWATRGIYAPLEDCILLCRHQRRAFPAPTVWRGEISLVVGCNTRWRQRHEAVGRWPLAGNRQTDADHSPAGG